jgi:DNA-binding MarR family transcriptional regulator
MTAENTIVQAAGQDIITEVLSLLEKQKEILKNKLAEIDSEISELNRQINEIQEKLSPLIAKRAELMSERVKVAKLLSLLDPTENANLIIGTSVERRRRSSEIDDKVLELLRNNPDGLTQIQIARYLGLPPSTVYHSLNRLLAMGAVEKDGSRFRAK